MFGKAEAELMDDIYNALYKYQEKDNHGDRMEELAVMFDDNMKTDDEFKELVEQIDKCRGDLIMSDREAAAFMLMYAFV